MNRNIALQVGFGLLLLGLWQWLPQILGTPTYIFPTLSTVCSTFLEDRQIVQANLIATLYVALWGFAVGCLGGFMIGSVIGVSKMLRTLFSPYIIGSNSIPIVAIAPLLTLWLGHGMVSKVAITAFLCFFPMTASTQKGLSAYSQKYDELFDAYGATKFQTLLRLKLPNAVPYLFVGLKTCAAYSVIGALVSEFIGAEAGLGYGIIQASYSLNTPRLFVYLVFSIVAGIGLYGIVSLVERKIFRKYSVHGVN